MALINPPLTENKTLNLTLLSLVRELNLLNKKQINLITDISEATSFSDLQDKVKSRQ